MKMFMMVKIIVAMIVLVVATAVVARSLKPNKPPAPVSAQSPMPLVATTLPAIHPTSRSTTGPVQLTAPDLSDVMSLRITRKGTAILEEIPTTTWTDISSGIYIKATRSHLPGGDYLSIETGGHETWRWREGSKIIGHYAPSRISTRIGGIAELRQMAGWINASLIPAPDLDAIIDGKHCRAFREILTARQKRFTTEQVDLADDSNRLRRLISHAPNGDSEADISYAPEDAKAAITPPTGDTIDLAEFLPGEYPIDNAETKNAEGLTVAVHSIKRDDDGRYEVLLSVRRQQIANGIPSK